MKMLITSRCGNTCSRDYNSQNWHGNTGNMLFKIVVCLTRHINLCILSNVKLREHFRDNF